MGAGRRREEAGCEGPDAQREEAGTKGLGARREHVGESEGGARGVRGGGARVSAPRPRDAFSNLQPPQPTRLSFATSSFAPGGRIPPPETRRADAASLLRGCGGPRKRRSYRPVNGP